jgi:cytochrome oxidase assembly protein ShyY1
VTAQPVGVRFDPEWRITLFTLVLLPLMIGLGFWQLQRAEEKAQLASSWEQRQQQAPARLEDVWEQSTDTLAYLPVSLRGEFLPDEYFLLDNRTRGGRFGYEVLGTFRLEGSERLVLVNRGWLAGDPARLTLPDVPRVEGTVELGGHVYVAPGVPYLLAEQEIASTWPALLQAVEMDKLVPVLQGIGDGAVFPYPVRLGADQPGALAADWQVVNVSPQKHRAYAVQWFTMAFALLVLYLLRCTNLWQVFKSIFNR